MLGENFKPQHKETILHVCSICKLTREQNANAEEWMDCLRMKGSEFEYKDDRGLNLQFINGINSDMMTEIIQELTAVKKTREITS